MAMAPTAPVAQEARRAAVTEEERRRNRMTSNRLSARKSRMKRHQHVEELTATKERLERENAAHSAAADGAQRRCHLLEQENRVLAAHARELCAALLLRNSQLRTLGEFAGVPLDVPGVPDHLALLYAQMPVHSPSSPPVSLEVPGVPDHLARLYAQMGPVHSPSSPPVPLEIPEMFFLPSTMDAAVGMLGFR